MPANARHKLHSDDFTRVFREGVAVSTPKVVVHTGRRAEGLSGRYGVVVSRKVGGAVERNRAKRQIRAALAMAGGVPEGMDAVIIVKPGAKLTVAELAGDIWQILVEHGTEST